MTFKSILNKKAFHDYEVIDEIEVGIVLTGPEVKSIRLGRASLRDSHVRIIGGQAYVLGLTINPYANARQEDYDPKGSRKLLLHRQEISKLIGKLDQKNITLIPLKIYQKHNRFKLKLGLARGKKQYQKKEVLKQRDLEREARRSIKDRIRYKG
jgi:SsrA-binding protein